MMNPSRTGSYVASTCIPAARCRCLDATCHTKRLPSGLGGSRLLYVRGQFNNWAATDNAALRWSCDHFEGVVAIEGLVLEVEPEEGAARDYRERARSGE